MVAKRNPNATIRLAIGVILFAMSSVCFADLAVIVHPSSKVNTLTSKQVKKLFLGRLHMLPATELEATIVDQEESQSAYLHFYSKLVKMSSIKLKRYRAAYLFSGKGSLPTTVADDVEVKSYVASHVTAVGYIDASLLDTSVKTVFLLPLE